MNNTFISSDWIAELTDLYHALLDKPPETLNALVARYPIDHGIYVITDPTDKEVVYVGRTIRAEGGLGRRIKGHVVRKVASDLNQKLGGDRILAGQHLVRAHVIEDPNYRRLAEHFGIASLRPTLNR
jgi:hypothetical protein